MIQQYVVGFLFDKGERQVVLIQKARPEWQAGRLNGVGGHVEPGESVADAMRREFVEETGLDVPGWVNFGMLRGDGFAVHLFRADAGPDSFAKTTTDEQVVYCDANNLPTNVLPNLRWLVPMAMSGQAHDWPLVIRERDTF